MEQLVTLQQTVITLLSDDRGTNNPFANLVHPNHSGIFQSTSSIRENTLSALGEQYQRLLQKLPIQQGAISLDRSRLSDINPGANSAQIQGRPLMTSVTSQTRSPRLTSQDNNRLDDDAKRQWREQARAGSLRRRTPPEITPENSQLVEREGEIVEEFEEVKVSSVQIREFLDQYPEVRVLEMHPRGLSELVKSMAPRNMTPKAPIPSSPPLPPPARCPRLTSTAPKTSSTGVLEEGQGEDREAISAPSERFQRMQQSAPTRQTLSSSHCCGSEILNHAHNCFGPVVDTDDGKLHCKKCKWSVFDFTLGGSSRTFKTRDGLAHGKNCIINKFHSLLAPEDGSPGLAGFPIYRCFICQDCIFERDEISDHISQHTWDEICSEDCHTRFETCGRHLSN